MEPTIVVFARCVKEATAHPPSHSSAVRHYVSPRDFLGLIRAFVALVNEKRSELEDQQVRVGKKMKGRRIRHCHSLPDQSYFWPGCVMGNFDEDDEVSSIGACRRAR